MVDELESPRESRPKGPCIDATLVLCVVSRKLRDAPRDIMCTWKMFREHRPGQAPKWRLRKSTCFLRWSSDF